MNVPDANPSGRLTRAERSALIQIELGELVLRQKGQVEDLCWLRSTLELELQLRRARGGLRVV
ncbi:MAG: hypothetical protein ACRDV9_06585 [Acidimicrobiia bacterium]